MIKTHYYGYLDIEYWEYTALFLYFTIIYLVFARMKTMRVKKEPEYAYFLWGLFAKTIGGVAFSLIFFYYYKGGDTISYFVSAKSLANLAREDPVTYLYMLFAENSLENRANFTIETGFPYTYVYTDHRAYMVCRIVSPILLFTFDSYLVTTAIVASISFIGIWKCFQTFFRYYPSAHKQLAFAFLFVPSCIFWGSSILKDTFTFSAFCWFIHAVDNIFFRGRPLFGNLVTVLLSSFILVAIKPYIFIVALPVSLVWVLHHRLSRIRNVVIKYFLLPFAFLATSGFLFIVLTTLGDRLGKFSLERSLNTIVVLQKDLKRSEEYGTNYFDIGEVEATLPSVLSKFPVATNAALFRPYLYECNNIVMVFAGLENTWLLAVFLIALARSRLVYFLTAVMRNPLVFMCIAFSVVYAFITGVSTPNFGALVRFKIPLLPVFISGLAIISYLVRERARIVRRGGRFDFERYRNGQPDAGLVIAEAIRKGKLT